MKIRDIINLDQKNRSLYVMSDLHLWHENVIKYDNRPFNSLEEMNNSILEELYTKLKPEDILIDLGDMFWDVKAPVCKEILDKIPVYEFYKVPGNHDRDTFYFGQQAPLSYRFKYISDILDLRVVFEKKKYRITLSHYPLQEWNHQRRGSLMVHGHCHGNIDLDNEASKKLRVDVGYNSNLAKRVGSFLIPVQEIIKYFYEKTGGQDFFDWSNNGG